MIKIFFLLSLFAISSQAANLGLITGKLVSITEKDIALQKGKTTYFIKKSALTPADTKQLSEIGKVITVQVPLEAVEAVKHDK